MTYQVSAQVDLLRKRSKSFKVVFIDCAVSAHLNFELMLHHAFPDACVEHLIPQANQNWLEFPWHQFDLVMLDQAALDQPILDTLAHIKRTHYLPLTILVKHSDVPREQAFHAALDLCFATDQSALDLAANWNIILELIRALHKYPLRVAGWQLTELLHHSENSLVFSAHNARGEKSAIKRFKFDISDADKEDIWGFLTSARTLMWFDHPGLARVLDANTYQDAVYLVMEYVEGQTLRTLLNETPRPDTAQILIWFEQIMRSLGAMHDIDLLHLDLKSSNIMVRPNGQTVLLDFGIEGRLLVETGFLRPSEIYCTPFYVSPERIVGEPPSVQSDLYALGVLFYEMLVGEKPYTGASLSSILQQHLFEPIPDLPTPFVHYQPLLNSLMAKSLELRPASTYAALKMLKSYQTH